MEVRADLQAHYQNSFRLEDTRIANLDELKWKGKQDSYVLGRVRLEKEGKHNR